MLNGETKEVTGSVDIGKLFVKFFKVPLYNNFMKSKNSTIQIEQKNICVCLLQQKSPIDS